jgi:glycosyltransferase involved in cell wall biosynthesis
MEKVPVTAVIPCYNCAETIERAVGSVHAQTRKPAEVILVDDCSGDGTLAVLHKLAAGYPPGWITVIALPDNVGAGEARNAGWNKASQPYLAFLDADDSWHPQKLEIQYGWMSAHPEESLTGHACRQLEPGDGVAAKENFRPEAARFAPVSKKSLLFSNRFPTRSVMLRRDLPARFATGKRHCEDYLLWLELVCGGFSASRCEWPLAYLYKAPYGEEGLSAQLWNMEQGQLDAYRRLHRKGRIGTAHYAWLRVWSWLRFSRRLMKTAFRGKASLPKQGDKAGEGVGRK